jgi:hypothetical protein
MVKLYLCANKYSDDCYTPDHLLVVAKSHEDALDKAFIKTGVHLWEVTQVMIPGYEIHIKEASK